MAKLRCFVAMAIGRKDTDFIYEKAIKEVVASLGLIPIRVDRVTHNDRVDEKIRSEIGNSDLVVADLTYARPSVYWEAGFAERSTPVIYTSRHDHFRGLSPKEDPFENFRIHFDLANANIIPWSEKAIERFKGDLRKRIVFVLKPIREVEKLKLAIDKEEKNFNSKSLKERLSLINRTLEYQLRFRKYKYPRMPIYKAMEEAAVDFSRTGHYGSTRQKHLGTSLIWLSPARCRESITKTYLAGLIGEPGLSPRVMPIQLIHWEWMPQQIRSLTRKKIKSTRTVWLISSISKVPKTRIEAALPQFRQMGLNKYYFRPVFDEFELDYRKRENSREGILLPTSCEIIFIDDIGSEIDYKAKLNSALSLLEKEKETLIYP